VGLGFGGTTKRGSGGVTGGQDPASKEAGSKSDRSKGKGNNPALAKTLNARANKVSGANRQSKTADSQRALHAAQLLYPRATEPSLQLRLAAKLLEKRLLILAEVEGDLAASVQRGGAVRHAPEDSHRGEISPESGEGKDGKGANDDVDVTETRKRRKRQPRRRRRAAKVTTPSGEDDTVTAAASDKERFQLQMEESVNPLLPSLERSLPGLQPTNPSGIEPPGPLSGGSQTKELNSLESVSRWGQSSCPPTRRSRDSTSAGAKGAPGLPLTRSLLSLTENLKEELPDQLRRKALNLDISHQLGGDQGVNLGGVGETATVQSHPTLDSVKE
jgi:hypothetical protein